MGTISTILVATMIRLGSVFQFMKWYLLKSMVVPSSRITGFPTSMMENGLVQGVLMFLEWVSSLMNKQRCMLEIISVVFLYETINTRTCRLELHYRYLMQVFSMSTVVISKMSMCS